jgi:hypothetical protein
MPYVTVGQETPLTSSCTTKTTARRRSTCSRTAAHKHHPGAPSPYALS